MSPSLYRHVMLLCERIGSATAAKAIGEDMARQGIVMDKECVYNFIRHTCKSVIIYTGGVLLGLAL